jgi:thioredoxin-like negative regulator of GroEL
VEDGGAVIGPSNASIALSMMGVIEKAPGVVLIKFFRENCAPCVAAGKVIDELFTEFGDKASFVSVNLTDHPSLAEAYGVDMVPFVLILQDGEQRDFMPPAIRKTGLRRKLMNVLGIV